MKKILLLGVALGALTVAAQAADVSRPYVAPTTTYAPPKVSGDLSIYGGWFRFSDNSPYAFNGWVIGGLSRANVWLNPTLSAQFDINGDVLYSSYDDTFDGAVNFAAHLSHRSQPGHLLGVMVSTGYNVYWEEQLATIAAEGQVPLGMLQLYGQVGYTNDITYGGGGWYVHGEARHFFNPNLMIAANIGFATLHRVWRSSHGHQVGPRHRKEAHQLAAWLLCELQGKYQRRARRKRVRAHPQHRRRHQIHFNVDTLQGASQSGATLKDYNPYTGVNHTPYYDYQ